MPSRTIDRNRQEEDWQGNNIAVTCPICTNVFLVSDIIHRGERACPGCGQSVAHVRGGHDSGGAASIEWQE